MKLLTSRITQSWNNLLWALSKTTYIYMAARIMLDSSTCVLLVWRIISDEGDPNPSLYIGYKKNVRATPMHATPTHHIEGTSTSVQTLHHDIGFIYWCSIQPTHANISDTIETDTNGIRWINRTCFFWNDCVIWMTVPGEQTLSGFPQYVLWLRVFHFAKQNSIVEICIAFFIQTYQTIWNPIDRRRHALAYRGAFTFLKPQNSLTKSSTTFHSMPAFTKATSMDSTNKIKFKSLIHILVNSFPVNDSHIKIRLSM